MLTKILSLSAWWILSLHNLHPYFPQLFHPLAYQHKRKTFSQIPISDQCPQPASLPHPVRVIRLGSETSKWPIDQPTNCPTLLHFCCCCSVSHRRDHTSKHTPTQKGSCISTSERLLNAFLSSHFHIIGSCWPSSSSIRVWQKKAIEKHPIFSFPFYDRGLPFDEGLFRLLLSCR